MVGNGQVRPQPHRLRVHRQRREQRLFAVKQLAQVADFAQHPGLVALNRGRERRRDIVKRITGRRLLRLGNRLHRQRATQRLRLHQRLTHVHALGSGRRGRRQNHRPPAAALVLCINHRDRGSQELGLTAQQGLQRQRWQKQASNARARPHLLPTQRQ